MIIYCIGGSDAVVETLTLRTVSKSLEYGYSKKQSKKTKMTENVFPLKSYILTFESGSVGFLRERVNKVGLHELTLKPYTPIRIVEDLFVGFRKHEGCP